MKVLCVLYPDPITGFPYNTDYAREGLPQITHYPNGQTLPTPSKIDFTPGQLLGSVSGELGLRAFLEANGHQFVVTSDKEGPHSIFAKEIVDADIVISQPFWPAYLSHDLIEKAPQLKLAITAGIGSDHVDLHAAMNKNITVAEVTYCNSISVAEHTVMMILSLVRDYIHQHKIVLQGDWNIADAVMRSYDLEGMAVGVIGSGRIGLRVLECLKPFGVHLHYFDRHRLSPEIEQKLDLTFHDNVKSLVQVSDVVSIHCPLHHETENLFDEKMISAMKRGSYIVNPARGKICNTQAIVKALESGQLAGYAGDVWFPQPAPSDHPWRSMPHQAMTTHTSGTSLSAQARYAAGTREILESFFSGKPIRPEYLIVQGGRLAGSGSHSYS